MQGEPYGQTPIQPMTNLGWPHSRLRTNGPACLATTVIINVQKNVIAGLISDPHILDGS